jgi:hypothetical protein
LPFIIITFSPSSQLEDDCTFSDVLLFFSHQNLN